MGYKFALFYSQLEAQMNFSRPIPNWELSLRFSVDQLRQENYLPEELRKRYRTSRGLAYFQAYEKFGMVERYGYLAASGLAFMAVVFEIAGEVRIPSSDPTSPYFHMCMEVARKLSDELLKMMNEDPSEATSLIRLFISLAYQMQPNLH